MVKKELIAVWLTEAQAKGVLALLDAGFHDIYRVNGIARGYLRGTARQSASRGYEKMRRELMDAVDAMNRRAGE